MDETEKESLKRDFLDWSGGFPPEDPDHVKLYLEVALPKDLDAKGAEKALTQWMEEEWRL